MLNIGMFAVNKLQESIADLEVEGSLVFKPVFRFVLLAVCAAGNDLQAMSCRNGGLKMN